MSDLPVKELSVAIADWAMAHGGDGAYMRPGLFVATTEPTDGCDAVKVECNPHPHPCDGLDPFTFRVTPVDENRVAICIATPVAGTLMGFREDELIEHFRAQAGTP